MQINKLDTNFFIILYFIISTSQSQSPDCHQTEGRCPADSWSMFSSVSKFSVKKLIFIVCELIF